MHKQVLWAALISSGILVSAFSLSACSKVESCKPGELGCVGGKADKGKCQFDLVERNGKCVEPGTDAGPMSACAPCDDPALCVPERKQCVNYCEIPTEFPGSVPALAQIFCGGEKDGNGDAVVLTFEQTCKNTCLLTCRWQNQFCDGYDCTDYCDQPDRLTECMDATTGCGAGATDADKLACQQTKCTDIRGRGCKADATLCPNSFKPVCGDVHCSNDCTGNVFDGYCDDGAFSNSGTDFCPWGTDCADCGPRLGKPRAVDVGDIQLGDLCPNSFRCAGNTLDEGSSVLPNGSWCRPIGKAEDGLFRCLLDCSSEGKECPTGFECRTLDYKDDKMRPGKACFPAKACL